MPTSFQTANPGDPILDTHFEQFIEPIQDLESGKPWFGSDIGATNAFEVNLDPAPSAYTEGMLVHFVAANDATGAATLELNGLGPKSLVKEGSAALVSGDIVENQMVSAIYDGANFHVISQVMNPTVSAAAPTENVLVYSEVCKESTSTTATNLSLPSYTFSSAKAYLMVLKVSGISTSTNVRVTLSDGVTSYAYPGASTFVKARTALEGKFYKKLPTLNGSHTVVVNVAAVGHVEVKFYEIYDNLVYADFSAVNTSTTAATASLAGFTATSGHKYLLKVVAPGYSTVSSGFAAYLTSGGVDVGLPQSGPTTDMAAGGADVAIAEASRILTGLSGAYTVTARGKSHSGLSVLIYDIT